MKQVEREIFDEMVKAMELLGAESDLLSIVGSFQETLPDEVVLESLRAWNVSAKGDNRFSSCACL